MFQLAVFFVLMFQFGGVIAKGDEEEEEEEMKQLRLMTVDQRKELMKGVAGELMDNDRKKEVLSLKIKKLLEAGDFLKDDDLYKNVMTSKTQRYYNIRSLIIQNLAMHLLKELAVDAKTKKPQKWSDFDAYNNYETLKTEIKEDDLKALQTQMRTVERRLARLRDEIIDFWQLKGMDEYKEEVKGIKKKVTTVKTIESMAAGN